MKLPETTQWALFFPVVGAIAAALYLLATGSVVFFPDSASDVEAPVTIGAPERVVACHEFGGPANRTAIVEMASGVVYELAGEDAFLWCHPGYDAWGAAHAVQYKGHRMLCRDNRCAEVTLTMKPRKGPAR